MSWDKLSMTERANYIKLGVQNNITDLNTIRKVYNSLYSHTLPEVTVTSKGRRVKKFGEGGEKGEYTPSTLAGWVTQLVTRDNSKAAIADISSSAINTGVDAIPIIGNAVGAAISIGDALYDTGKYIKDPSGRNAAELGLSLIGVLPGIGSVKDAKNIAEAVKQDYKYLKSTRAAKSTRTAKTVRKSPSSSKAGRHISRPNWNLVKNNVLQLYTEPYTKILGTEGTLGNALLDTSNGINFLDKKK